MNHPFRPSRDVRLAVACLLLTTATGCTSVLTSASLRDLVWDGDGHAAETAPPSSDAEADDDRDPPTADSGSADEATADAQRRRAAVEEATARLARLDHLDDAARATLTETLERTQQEDWPAVIDAFAETLADVGLTQSPTAGPEAVGESIEADAGDDADGSIAAAAEPDATETHVVAKADLDAAAGDAATSVPKTPGAAEPPLPPEPASAPAAEEVVATVAETPAAADAGPGGSVSVASAAATVNTLAIENACFASRVQAWGVLDRFAADRFRPGQEVIVYFELDGLSAGESPAGHTTCIDSELRLVDGDDSLIHAWSFEPIAETCRARRRDYFARYVVRLPETGVTGGCRVELQVTDTLSGQVATATLPLEVVADDTAP